MSENIVQMKNKKKDFSKAKFDVVSFGNVRALYSSVRVRQWYDNVPDDVLIYATRHGDEGYITTLEKNVRVNHDSDIILNPETAKEIIAIIEKDEYLDVWYDEDAEEENPNCIDFESFSPMTYAEFMNNEFPITLYRIKNEEGKFLTMMNSKMTFTDNEEFAYDYEEDQVDATLSYWQEKFGFRLTKDSYERKPTK